MNVTLDFQKSILSGDTSRFADGELPLQAFAIEKSRIAENGDFNLSGDRYRTTEFLHQTYEMVELGNSELFRVESGGTPDTKTPEYWNGEIHWATLVDLPASDFISEIVETERKISQHGLNASSAKIIPTNSIIVSSRATIGRVGINRIELATNQGFKNIIIKDRSKVLPEFVALMMTKLKDKMEEMASGGTFKEISKSNFCSLKIPLPPLSVQREIVERVEGYQRLIDGAKQVVQSFKINIQINPDWHIVELGEFCEWITKGSTPTSLGFKYEDEGVNFIRIENIDDDGNIDRRGMKFISEECNNKMDRSKLRKNDILFSIAGTKMGITGRVTEELLPANTNQALAIIRPKEEIDADFLFHYLKSQNIQNEIERIKVGVAQFNLSLKQVSELKIALPSVEEQKQIVTQIKREQKLVNANRELIEIYEQKIKDEINRLWEE